MLRASGDEAYNDWIYNLSIAAGTKLNSVRTILTKDKKASDETEVLTLLRSAEAIFMAGGDQSQYLDYWSGTEIQSIIQSKLLTVTVGGTSAGCAILGNWVYTGEKGSATSEEALANPYDRYITIVPAFLHIPFLETIVTDTHFGKLYDCGLCASLSLISSLSHSRSHGPHVDFSLSNHERRLFGGVFSRLFCHQSSGH